MSALDRLADLVGLEPFYHDIWGNRRETSPATKRALVGAMGLAAATDDEADASLRALEGRAWHRPLPPVLVIEAGQGWGVPVALPTGLDSAVLSWTLTTEDGRTHDGALAVHEAPLSDGIVIDGQGFERRELGPRLPVDLPLGYHRLTVSVRPQGGAACWRARRR